MLRSLRSRRRQRNGPQLCAVISALLLLISVSVLYNRLSSSQHNPSFHELQNDAVRGNPLLSDSDDAQNGNDDKIDELDFVDEDQNDSGIAQNDISDDFLDGEVDGDEGNIRNSRNGDGSSDNVKGRNGYYMDHVTGSIRRSLNKKSIAEWDYDYMSSSSSSSSSMSSLSSLFSNLGVNFLEDKSKAAFGSDDIPVDEGVRRKLIEVRGIEDALLLKVFGGKRVSPLREGWGNWFDKKGEFLRRDKMFKSNWEALNPLNNPLLHDPDGAGVTTLTRGDKAVQKLFLNEFKKTPFPHKRTLSVSVEGGVFRVGRNEVVGGDKESTAEIKRAERRTLDQDTIIESANQKVDRANLNVLKDDNSSVKSDGIAKGDSGDRNLGHDGTSSNARSDADEIRKMSSKAHVEAEVRQRKAEELSQVTADGRRWGYFPGLHPHLSFSDFIDSFFRKGDCGLKVFMVWNSPPWMYSVRHQRGLESLLSQHRDACVVVFSETMNLNFFKDSFVKDGYKVAVAMPNLDELLINTPTHVFASVWFQWRKTQFYPTHYSELVRLAALYKYGGVYLDSDIIVLNPLSSLNNVVVLEDQFTRSNLNGAVMVFRKNSPFIMECMKEFYMTYDDTRLRWNGADLLTRVARNFLRKDQRSRFSNELDLKVQPSSTFFPISSQNITSYFTTPVTMDEKAQQDALFKKIVSESLTFHFWSSLTSTLIPEPESLVARLINHSCIRCSDVL